MLEMIVNNIEIENTGFFGGFLSGMVKTVSDVTASISGASAYIATGVGNIASSAFVLIKDPVETTFDLYDSYQIKQLLANRQGNEAADKINRFVKERLLGKVSFPKIENISAEIKGFSETIAYYAVDYLYHNSEELLPDNPDFIKNLMQNKETEKFLVDFIRSHLEIGFSSLQQTVDTKVGRHQQETADQGIVYTLNFINTLMDHLCKHVTSYYNHSSSDRSLCSFEGIKHKAIEDIFDAERIFDNKKRLPWLQEASERLLKIFFPRGKEEIKVFVDKGMKGWGNYLVSFIGCDVESYLWDLLKKQILPNALDNIIETLVDPAVIDSMILSISLENNEVQVEESIEEWKESDIPDNLIPIYEQLKSSVGKIALLLTKKSIPELNKIISISFVEKRLTKKIALLIIKKIHDNPDLLSEALVKGFEAGVTSLYEGASLNNDGILTLPQTEGGARKRISIPTFKEYEERMQGVNGEEGERRKLCKEALVKTQKIIHSYFPKMHFLKKTCVKSLIDKWETFKKEHWITAPFRSKVGKIVTAFMGVAIAVTAVACIIFHAPYLITFCATFISATIITTFFVRVIFKAIKAFIFEKEEEIAKKVIKGLHDNPLDSKFAGRSLHRNLLYIFVDDVLNALSEDSPVQNFS